MGVSLDEDCDLAAKVARENQAKWPQVCDGKGLEGELPRRFNAKATASYYLIAPDGELAAKRVRPQKIEELLEEMLVP